MHPDPAAAFRCAAARAFAPFFENRQPIQARSLSETESKKRISDFRKILRRHLFRRRRPGYSGVDEDDVYRYDIGRRPLVPGISCYNI